MRNNVKRAIVFDFDGVVIDSTEVQRIAFTESCRSIVGKEEASFEEFLSHSGDSLENIFRKMGLPLSLLENYRRISRENISSIILFNGIYELLCGLRRAQFNCALCTGKDRLRTLELLEHFNLEDFFDVVVCSDDVSNPKPHPESLVRILDELSVERQNALMVGDAVNDLICARSAGVSCVGVSWGELSRNALERENPDFIVDSIDGLAKTIGDFFSMPIPLHLKEAKVSWSKA